MMDSVAEFPEVHRAQLGARCLFNKLSQYIPLVKGRKETAGPEMDQLAIKYGGWRIEDVSALIFQEQMPLATQRFMRKQIANN